jgi:hypothetical protein
MPQSPYRHVREEQAAKEIRTERGQVERGTSVSDSMFASALSEARHVKTPVSLLFIIVLAGASFYAGRSSPPPEHVERLMVQIERSTLQHEQTTKKLENLEALLGEHGKALIDLKSSSHTQSVELQYVSSHFKTAPSASGRR